MTKYKLNYHNTLADGYKDIFSKDSRIALSHSYNDLVGKFESFFTGRGSYWNDKLEIDWTKGSQNKDYDEKISEFIEFVYLPKHEIFNYNIFWLQRYFICLTTVGFKLSGNNRFEEDTVTCEAEEFALYSILKHAYASFDILGDFEIDIDVSKLSSKYSEEQDIFEDIVYQDLDFIDFLEPTWRLDYFEKNPHLCTNIMNGWFQPFENVNLPMNHKSFSHHVYDEKKYDRYLRFEK